MDVHAEVLEDIEKAANMGAQAVGSVKALSAAVATLMEAMKPIVGAVHECVTSREPIQPSHALGVASNEMIYSMGLVALLMDEVTKEQKVRDEANFGGFCHEAGHA